MDFSQIPLFALADRRTAWLAARQATLAQNIANADTPGWKARDVAAFGSMLAPGLPLAATAPGHLAGNPVAPARIQPLPAETSPDGNTVALDRELAKVAETDTAHEVAVGLTKSYMAMFRTVIGH